MNARDGALNRGVRIGLVALLLVTLAGLPAAAETYHPMRFERISLEQGLSQSNVFSILQDSRGLMWFGTESGLNSYNGYEFEIYKRDRGEAWRSLGEAQ